MPEPDRPLTQTHHQVASLLGHPLPRRMRGHPEHVHPPRIDLDDEQHVEPAQQHRVNGEVHQQVQRRDCCIRGGHVDSQTIPVAPEPDDPVTVTPLSGRCEVTFETARWKI